ncbi:hypothetical protein D3P05_24050, partial [Paracoccus siganidrum]
MARGFWTGLAHGGALSVAALAILAVLLPVPRTTVPDAEGEAPAPSAAQEAAPEAAPEPAPESVAPTGDADEPAAPEPSR